MRVLALTRYGSLAASTRQRFLQYHDALAAAGITLDFSPFDSDEQMRRLVRGDRRSLIGTGTAYLRRLRALETAGRYDLLWLHCESFPYLPGTLERLAFRSGKPVVYDFDDAIFHIYDSSSNPLVRHLLGRKLEPLLSRAAACTCGNDYLARYAARYCDRTLVVPTVVDTDIYEPAEDDRGGPATIGWIGSPSTWPLVRPLLPLLAELHRSHQVRFRAVGAGRRAEADRFEGLDLIEWSEQSEVAEVQAMDIGIMPLIDSPFVRGKSGYKLIQYMACGLPTVASPIGVNADIVEPGRTGFLATTIDEWRQALKALIGDAALRRHLGTEGRRKAVRAYSLQSQAPRLVELFRSLAPVTPH